MTRLLLIPALTLGLLGSSCASLTDPSSAYVGGSAAFASEYWFRGAPVNTRPVVQGDLSLAVNTADEGALSFYTWFNMDASNDTGAAFAPNGNGSQVTEADYVLEYSRSIGSATAAAGVVNYNFPNVGRSTSEVYLGISTALWGFGQALTLYRDFDVVDGNYLSLQGSKTFQVNELTSVDIGLLLGHMDSKQAGFYFGNRSSGLSDVAASVTINHTLDDYTTLFVSLVGVRPLDSDFRDALDAALVDDSALIAAFGLSWGF